MSAVFLDSFSGSAAELRPSQRHPDGVLAALRKDPRISTFDLSETKWLRGCIDTLKRQGRITECKGEAYPWHRYAINDSAIGAHKEGD